MFNEKERAVWAEVNLENIRFNIKQAKKNVSQETIIMAVVKADAYGHGAIKVARAAIEAGAKRLAVALPEEGIELREAGFDLPIQVFGEVLAPQLVNYIDYDLIPTVSSEKNIEELNRLALEKGIRKKLQVIIDTGMGRVGVFPEDALDFIQKAVKMPGLEVEGIMTHFSKADEMDKEYTYQQWEKFNYVIRQLKENGINIPFKQSANSATIIDLPHMDLDIIRPGIMIYGLRPSHEVDKDFTLKPAMIWKTKIVYLKEVPRAYGISYGATYVSSKKTKVATLPLGYADGYPRLLSNKADVLINGKRAPIIGRVCMDQFMVDVTNIPASKVGDEVVLIGKQGNEEIKATELADLIGTINYEITCGVSKRVPRVYKNE